MDEQEEFSIWPPYKAFYIESMLFNTTSALQSCEIVHDYIQDISDGKTGLQDRTDELLNNLHNIINQAGAISRYFFPSREASRDSSAHKKNIHKNRGEYLCKIFQVTAGNPLENRRLRNSIEHFDEKLDLYLEGEIVGYIFPSLVLYESKETKNPHHIFRGYYLKEGIFQILSERYEIQPIVDELGRIHDLLVKLHDNG